MPTGKYTLSDLVASPTVAPAASANQTGQYSAADLAGPAPVEDGSVKPESTFMPAQNAWFKRKFPRIYSAFSNFVTAPDRGIDQIVSGIKKPGLKPAERMADVLEGGATALSPGLLLVPGAGVGATVKTGAAILAAPHVGEAAADFEKAVGGSPETQRLTKDLAEVATFGAITHGRVGTRGGPSPAGAAIEEARGPLADALRGSAEKQYGQVLNATTRGNKVRAARLAPEAIERRVTAFSLKGLNEQATAGMEAAGRALNDAYEGLPEGSAIPLDEVKGKISAAAQEAFTVPDANGEPLSMSKVADAGLNHAAEIVNRLELVAKVNPETGLKEIPVGTARRMRQYFDEVAKAAGRYDGKELADQSAGAVHGMAADAMREHLNKLATGESTIGDLNKEFQFWKDMNRVTGDTILRRQGQAKPLGRKLMGAAGVAGGFATGGVKGALAGKAVMDMIERVTTSPGWGTVSAVVKDRLAGALAKGEPGPISFYAKQAEREASAVDRPSAVAAGAPEGATMPANGAASSEPSGAQAGAGGTGAPVQGPAAAGPGVGKETTVSIPGEPEGYPANYAVRELADVRTSHSGLNFQPNPKYGLVNDRDYTKADNQGKVLTGSLPKRFDPRFHVTDNPDATNGPIVIDSQGNALGGNGRGMILQRVYSQNPEGAQAYRQMLVDNAAHYGLDPEHVKSLKQPVLVRQISSDVENPQQAVTDLNKTGTAALRPAERIIADSKRVSQATLDDIGGRLEAAGHDATLADTLKGKAGAEILNRLIDDGIVSPQERAALASGDELTAGGRDRIQKLLLGRFFDSPQQLESIQPAIRNKLERVAAPLAKVEGGEWSLTPAISQAVDLLEELRAHGGRLDDFLKQRALLSSRSYTPEAVSMARALQTMTGKELAAAVSQYAEDAQFAAGGENLFGASPTPAGSFGVFIKKAGENPRKGL